MKKWLLPFFALALAGNASAQPAPYRGTLIFDLTLDLWQPLSPAEIHKLGVQFLSEDKEATLRYDSLQKHWVYTENGFNNKCLYLLYRGDTVSLRYASVRGIDFHLLAPVPLDGKNYAFDSPVIYDAIHSNTQVSGRSDCMRTFYMCRGCFISRYEAPRKEERPDPFPLWKIDWQTK